MVFHNIQSHLAYQYQKTGYVRIILNKISIFSKYFKPLYKFLILSDSCLYMVHRGLRPFFGRYKNSRNRIKIISYKNCLFFNSVLGFLPVIILKILKSNPHFLLPKYYLNYTTN